MNLGIILHHFRDRDISFGVNPFKSLEESSLAKTRVLWLSTGEDFMILACVNLIQYQRTRQTCWPWLLQCCAHLCYADLL